MRGLWGRLGRIGSDESDPEDVRLEKSLLVYLSVSIGLAAVVWGVVYSVLGVPRAGAIPLSYSLISAATLVVFAANHRYRFYQFSQLSLILVLPAALALELGGFGPSSAVVLWASLAPLGALMWGSGREAVGWFVAFVALVLLVAIAPPEASDLSQGAVNVFFVMNIVTVVLIAGIALGHFVRERDREREKSESLLLNVLPREIAAELREHGRTQARHYESVSILFADLVGFTPMSHELPPEEVLALLDRVFTEFDALVDAAGVEKVRTIGDAYMISAGAPTPRPDHAPVLVQVGLDMLQAIELHNTTSPHRLQLRVGINSGPAVAGVIGRSKFQWDIWGDTVNLASRMESHGQPGYVQIASGTRALIGDQFDVDARGEIDVKGRGPLPAWFVYHTRNAQAAPPAGSRSTALPGGAD